MKQVLTLALIYFAALIGGIFFFEFMSTILCKIFSFERDPDNMLPTALGSLAGSLLACFYFHKKGLLTLSRSFLKVSSKTYLLPIIVLGVSLFYIDEYLQYYLSKIFTFPSEQESNGVINIILQLFGVLLIAPFFEEIVFRGVLFKTILPKMGFIKSSLIVSIIFGVLHFEPVAIPFLIASSVLYCWVYMRTGNLILTMILHLINNALTAALLYGNISLDSIPQSSPINKHIYLIIAIGLFVFCLMSIYKKTKQHASNE